jgi:hypothetical protein
MKGSVRAQGSTHRPRRARRSDLPRDPAIGRTSPGNLAAFSSTRRWSSRRCEIDPVRRRSPLKCAVSARERAAGEVCAAARLLRRHCARRTTASVRARAHHRAAAVRHEIGRTAPHSARSRPGPRRNRLNKSARRARRRRGQAGSTVRRPARRRRRGGISQKCTSRKAQQVRLTREGRRSSGVHLSLPAIRREPRIILTAHTPVASSPSHCDRSCPSRQDKPRQSSGSPPGAA